MQSLTSILKEIQSTTNHAIFLSGAPGSGKTYISKQLGIPSDYVNINIDTTYEEMLKKSGLGVSAKHFGPEELSKANSILQTAKKTTDIKYKTALEQRKNIIVDGTGASSKPLLKRKQELEDLGYKTFMIAIYVSPIVSLERNANRERSLMPSIVLSRWKDYTKNIDIYRQSFGDTNFTLVDNNSKGVSQEYNSDEIKKLYFDTTTVHGKPKSKEEMDKARQSKEEINREVSQLVKIEQQFDNLETAKHKINKFIKS